ncbi:hypothetical protein JCM19241_1275 [Vibrio ishigakensis]|uniref:Uncharacterized protein n=1 Tax=Vibrio ishigakensis TaxID=1481914 RepID=A0A0B8QDF0_9VIBR|nr:hypothetical protein JCM19241_1275 [Vibrio ishigakensis]
MSIGDPTEIELTFSDTHHVSGDLDINQGYYKVEINDNIVGTTPRIPLEPCH